MQLSQQEVVGMLEMFLDNLQLALRGGKSNSGPDWKKLKGNLPSENMERTRSTERDVLLKFHHFSRWCGLIVVPACDPRREKHLMYPVICLECSSFICSDIQKKFFQVLFSCFLLWSAWMKKYLLRCNSSFQDVLSPSSEGTQALNTFLCSRKNLPPWQLRHPCSFWAEGLTGDKEKPPFIKAASLQKFVTSTVLCDFHSVME